MPAPISNALSPDPTIYTAESGTCDPTIASCALPEKLAPSVNLEPIEVTGEIGTRHLVERYDQSRMPNCSAEIGSTVLACASAGATALGAVAAAGTGIGLIAGVALTLVQGVNCGKELAALKQCETQ